MKCYNSNLKSIQGDIFRLDDNLIDTAIAFVAGGGIGFHFKKNLHRIENSEIAYLIFTDGYNHSSEGSTKPYKSRVEMFISDEEIRGYIDRVMCSALDDAYSIGNRIATSGMWIRGLDQIKNETWMVESISHWLDSHPEAQVTIIDIADNINRHGILN